MKITIFFTACFLLSGAIVSGCSGRTAGEADTADSVRTDTVVQMLSPEEADHMSYCVGFLNGADAGVNKRKMAEESPEYGFDNGSYMKGFRTALSQQNASPGYTQGVQAARDIIFKIEELRSYGVEVNREILLQAISRQFSADSVTADRMQHLNSKYNVMLQRVYSAGGK